ncbi:TRAP transporter substrate-binding protein [Alkalibacillus salilacus]|uniref:Tripartite ATP-independent transporter DctP family solute receptor n=1 Tax=Alkalibacillus salilacus TaxID=284582 RepID=A0ABT9VHM8_9BACI|nr:TRAP transporter substrate-binding protein [Alkalibacillus salilacus]MDQ0160462.1 tripartite ATP-independent transporter DctP family solute receptor [Alkalibacillus salilacus]
MRKVLLLAVAILVLGILAACGGSDEGSGDSGSEGEGSSDSIKIVAAHNQTNEENPYQDGLLKFKEVAESESDGNIEVEVHAGTIGTSESELVEKLKTGAADVVLVSPGFMTSTGIDEVNLFAFPYLFDSYDHWESVVQGEVGDEMGQIINEESNNDFKLLGYWTAGVRHYYGKEPINSMDDLEGKTLRTQTSGVISDFWEQTGAVPTSVAWGELYQALQQDTVDSAENAYPYFVQQDHHNTDNGQYITETGHDYTTRFLLTNGNKFDEYTEEQQEIINQAAEASVEAEWESLYSQEDEYKEIAQEDGAEINQIDRQPFIDLAKPLQDEYAEEYGVTDLLEKVREAK